MAWLEPTLSWYLTTTLVTVAVAPLVLLLFRHVTDDGASVARPLGILLFIWPVWFLTSITGGIVPFSQTALWIALAIIAIICWAIGLRYRVLTRAALIHLAIAEVGYLIVFALYIWLHGYVSAVAGPGTTTDQEKPSDIMMLASTMQADTMPPLDAWLSGETINYYYIGYALHAGVGKMIGTTPAVAYTLALASTFAMMTVAVAGTAFNILSRFASTTLARVGGGIAVLTVLLIGNPWAAVHILRNPDAQWQGWPFNYAFWMSTRIIQDPGLGFNISEFPAFSFVLGDLHPHVLAMPFTVTALAIGWMFLTLPLQRDRFTAWLRIVIAGIAVTALYAMNSWDFPTWFLVVTIGLLLSRSLLRVRDRAIALAVMLGSGVVAWSPFIVNFQAPVGAGSSTLADALAGIPLLGKLAASIAAYTGERTPALEYLAIFGFFYPVVVAVIIIALFRARRQTIPDPLAEKLAWTSAILVVLIGVLVPAPLVIIAGLPVIAGIVTLAYTRRLTLPGIVTGLATLALVLTLIPEFFYLLDIYGNRMNTIFKLYLQAWIMLAIATALGLVALWQITARWRSGQAVIATITAVIITLGLLYPVFSASQWLQFKNADANWEGVNSLAWLNEGQTPDPALYDAIAWLWNNADNDDVLLAAGGCEWTPALGIASATTGVPAILGWAGHERQWRIGDEATLATLPERASAITTLFADPDNPVADQYDVTLMFIGRTATVGPADPNAVPGPTCAPGPFGETTSPAFPGPGWTEVFSEDGIGILRRET